MGQGAESCGGYEIDYDEYEDGLIDGVWTQRDGARIHVSKMTYNHLRNTRALVYHRLRASTFTCEEDKWQAWLDILDEYIDRKPQQVKKVSKPKKPVEPKRGKVVRMKCYCGKEYDARQADLNRGWGLTCCKSHAAVRRTYGRPAATRISNML